jgi:hypothetical protein
MKSSSDPHSQPRHDFQPNWIFNGVGGRWPFFKDLLRPRVSIHGAQKQSKQTSLRQVGGSQARRENREYHKGFRHP